MDNSNPTDEELAQDIRDAYITLRGRIRLAVAAGLKVTFPDDIVNELRSPNRVATRILIEKTL